MSIVIPSANNGGSVNGNSTNGATAATANGASHKNAPFPISTKQDSPLAGNIKHSWVYGKLRAKTEIDNSQLRIKKSSAAPQIGDCIVGRVSKLGNHSRLFTADNQYSRIYSNDQIIGVLGPRYATDAYHATEINTDNLHMLTNGGLIGTVCGQHRSMKKPTQVELLGYLVDELGSRINMKKTLFQPPEHFPQTVHPVFTVGTGMNSGKTTSTARLGQALSASGKRVAILKLTGSASHRDSHEFSATSPVFVADFCDYGFPSTYLSTIEELENLYARMLFDAAAESPDVVLIEIADGVYQQETEALLKSRLIRETASGVVLTAACAASAISIEQAVMQSGWNPIAITGLITNAPLFVNEFTARSTTPVCNTDTGIDEACRLILNRIQQRTREDNPAFV